MNLTDKIVFITGSSRGIGLAMAQAFAQKDAQVILNSRHELKPEVLQLFEKATHQPGQVLGDISDPEQAQNMIKTIKQTYGQLDVLINNAGITNDKMLLRMTSADFEQVLQTNLVGTFNVLQPALKLMYKQKAGTIINIASVVGLTGNIGQANYAAAKAGILGLTKTTALEGALRGIRCNAIAPGMVATDMTDALSEKVQAELVAKIPLKRAAKPEEIAHTAIFLAENEYITGQTITVDGGMVMQ
ncbi:3-oxoacyl-ACP reductase family protein [Agrilactobacillus fermenti]|uniref:3-oxoacyl-ACP reductase family protein n=1 Tax=Agrilactobacillus fermenti TaxID=2586909 RepID=UPI001E352244|nr:3-oxoacyl-ACP reductase family protein [Agrilactobacillus fermenti]MCD2255705.1 3-oxoacyl-ACP reductase FabG [Agrilactobacillus fermenti]